MKFAIFTKNYVSSSIVARSEEKVERSMVIRNFKLKLIFYTMCNNNDSDPIETWACLDE